MTSNKAISKKVNSNTFRHAIHTHGRGHIATSSLAAALQHSTNVAERHYIHTKAHDSTFAEFYSLVTRIDAEQPTVIETENESGNEDEATNIKTVIESAKENEIQEQEKNTEMEQSANELCKNNEIEDTNISFYDFDGLNSGDFVAVLFEEPYLGCVINSNERKITYLETIGNNKYVCYILYIIVEVNLEK